MFKLENIRGDDYSLTEGILDLELKECRSVDVEYFNLLKHILKNGEMREDRTGVGTISTFGTQSRYDLSCGFPLLTTKKINFTNIASELLWFISGDTNIRYLIKNNNNIWNEWAFEKWIKTDDFLTINDNDIMNKVFQNEAIDKGLNYRFENEDFNNMYKQYFQYWKNAILTNDDFCEKFGDLGPVYGRQWRNFNGVDQLKTLIENIKTNPYSRRHILSAWNPNEIEDMALPPCHTMFQFYVNKNKLSCQLYQRSADTLLGVPYNIASYALLTMLIAKECGLQLGEFVHTIGDAHVYTNHIEGAEEQLKRKPYPMPNLKINNFTSIWDVKLEDLELEDYKHHPFIKFPIAV